MKRTLKVKHYGRYVDDFYLVDSSREFLLACVEPIRRFLLEDLQLTLHPRKLWLQEVLTYDPNPFQIRSVVNSYRGHCCHFVTGGANRLGA